MTIYSEVGKAGLLRLYTDYTKSDEWRAKNHSKIAVIAYYKAQVRGFETGKEIQDWLEAENEIARLCVPPHEFFV